MFFFDNLEIKVYRGCLGIGGVGMVWGLVLWVNIVKLSI